MRLEGPSRAPAGSYVTVTASGFESRVEQVKFEAQGNIGWDVVPVAGGAARWRLQVDFTGATTITAQGQDGFGGNVGGYASHRIDVYEPGMESAGAFQHAERAARQLRCDAAVPAGQAWNAVISGLADAHSVVIEFFGANGGLFRIFPRGRSEMSVSYMFDAPGETQAIVSIRDQMMKTTDALEATFGVSPHGLLGSAPASRPASGRLLMQPVAPMGVAKPPIARPADAGPQPSRGGPPQAGVTAIAPSQAEAGAPWPVDLAGLKDAHSVVVEHYGANGGVHRIFPRGRDRMSLVYRFARPGQTRLCFTARDAQLRTLDAGAIEVMVGAAGHLGGRSGPVVRASPMAQGIAPLGAVKPPVAMLEGHADAGGAAAQSQPLTPLGGMDGPSTAEAGDTISVGFSTPLSAVEVRFSTSNADLHTASPQLVSGGSTVRASARVHAEGRAVIFGAAYDENGAVIHEAAHAVQVRATDPARAPSALGQQPQAGLADAMQRALEERLRARLGRRDD